MSLVVLATAQARVGDSVTQDMIDGVEAWLEGQIGPLTGERTEAFFLSQRRNLDIVDGLWLSRRTDLIDLTSDGDTLTSGTDYRLLNGLLIERIPTGAAWGDAMVATYTPSDQDVVTEAIISLLTYASLPSNLQSVRIGAYSETFATGGAAAPVTSSILGRISPRLGRYSMPFRYYRHREDRTLVEATGS